MVAMVYWNGTASGVHPLDWKESMLVVYSDQTILLEEEVMACGTTPGPQRRGGV